MIHRDVKPANVKLTPEGTIKLVDFGLVRPLDAGRETTFTGLRGMGSLPYTPLEQYGEVAEYTDVRSDIYALGATFYHMLTGRVPFEAETPLAVVLKHITDPLPMPRTINPAIPETVEWVILKALAKEPGDRYQSAGELAAAPNQVRGPYASAICPTSRSDFASTSSTSCRTSSCRPRRP